MPSIPRDLNDLFGPVQRSLPSSAPGKDAPAYSTRIPYRDRPFAKGLSPRHHAVLQYLLDHPAAKQQDIAAATGYTPTWVSRIINSPEFRAKLEAAMRPQLLDAAYRFLTEKPGNL